MYPDLKKLTIPYCNFKGEKALGTIIIDSSLSIEVEEIFRELFNMGFPIEKMEPIDLFNNDDNLSMKANNCYSFCYREALFRPGVLSMHSFGRAIDLNPIQNPYIRGDIILPKEGIDFLDREKNHPAMIKKGDRVYQAFINRGWIWGGEFEGRTDYHHFHKELPSLPSN